MAAAAVSQRAAPLVPVMVWFAAVRLHPEALSADRDAVAANSERIFIDEIAGIAFVEANKRLYAGIQAVARHRHHGQNQG